MECTLCLSKKTKFYFEKNEKSYGFRRYFQCHNCCLIFQDPNCHVDLNLETSIYTQHENTIENQGYVQFLNQLIQPMLKHLKPKQKGLDFGSGPGPTLHKIMAQHDFEVKNYDPIFLNNKEITEQTFDFITCTEVVEHFYFPHKDFALLKKLLAPQGILGVMTQTLPANKTFSEWWYHRDPTHVSFYSLPTFQWISQKFELKLIEVHKNVFIFKR